MFSGLVQQIGHISNHSRKRIGVQIPNFKAKLGDSIAINGVCLTLVKTTKNLGSLHYFFDISPETVAKTTIGKLQPGDSVNVEGALTMKDSLGGHIVQGHVDGVGRLKKIQPQTSGKIYWFEAPKDILKFLVPKGSVTVDGVSLTVVNLTKTGFSVALIPFTLENTNLGQLRVNDPVNLEPDIMGKYVAKFMRKK